MADTGAGQIFGALRKNCKPVIVGIDFGTAYSGIAYAYSADPSTIRYGAPTEASMQTKTPTVLLKMSDGTWKFGNDAYTAYNDLLLQSETGKVEEPLFKGFKMALKDKSSGFETLQALSTNGDAHSLMDLVVQSLTFLKDCAIDKVCGEHGSALNIKGASDVQWVLTVPAIWTEFGKAFMRRAAFRAGLMAPEQSDDLMLVLEPEAAALAVQEGTMSMEIFKQGSQFMVLDCGGGTIDVTAHQVQSIKPMLAMKSIAVPAGGAWGGETVNHQFKRFLQKLLTEEYFNESDYASELHHVYTEFERIKKRFDPAAGDGADGGQDSSTGSILKLADLLNSPAVLKGLVEAYNASMDAAKPPTPELKIVTAPISLNRGYISISQSLMLSFFEPSLAKIVTCTRSMLALHRGIEHIIIVGGYGGSKVVRQRVFSEFNGKNGVTCILTESRPKPQGAIAHGAVYDGMYECIMTSRVAKHTYGIGREGGSIDVLVHKGALLPFGHKVSIKGMPSHIHQTTCQWPLYQSDNMFPGQQADETLLGEVEAACPVVKGAASDKLEDRGQTASFYFGQSEIRVEVENAAQAKITAHIKF